ncbi:hypothetical protein ACHWQZ_G009841 [Mnemiopsis leidyi]
MAKGGTICYFDVKLGDDDLERIIMKLYDDVVPRTCANFKALCTGEQKTDELNLHFLNSIFHRVIIDFMIQGGDVTRMDGTGGCSIYGPQFEDENFEQLHDRAFLLSMANRGPNTNSSQFFITTAPAPHLDGKHVVFGEVVRGQSAVREIEHTKCKDDKPVTDCWIAGCGVLESMPAPVGDEVYSDHPQDCSLDISKATKVLEAAAMMKECGNKLFKEQDYLRAKHKYLKAVRYLDHDGYEADEACKNLYTTCQLNLAQCYNSLSQFKEAIKFCNKVLEKDGNSTKSYFRRAKAHEGLGEYDLAVVDYKKAAELSPEDKVLANSLLRADQLVKRQRNKDRQAYSKMFK